MVLQYSMEQLGRRSCSGGSQEDGGGMYRVGSEDCFWFLLKYFRDYIDFADFKACDTKVWWVVD